MLVYTFWESKNNEYNPDLPKIIDIPFSDLEDMYADSDDINFIVESWISSNYPGLKLKIWGEVKTKAKELMNIIDESTVTMFDALDVIFKEFEVSFYYKLDVMNSIFDYLVDLGHIFLGYEGIIYKIRKSTDVIKEKFNVEREEKSFA